jgi:rubrerythrin
MDIYEFAFNMEKDGEAYYRELADKTNIDGFKKILSMLADEEKKHQDIIIYLKKNQKAGDIRTDVFKNVKNIFIELKNDISKFNFNISEVKLYEKAQELEKKSEDFYKEKANEVENDEAKNILLTLAKEENKHYFILDNIIEVVSKPERWTEQAEFSPLDEY